MPTKYSILFLLLVIMTSITACTVPDSSSYTIQSDTENTDVLESSSPPPTSSYIPTPEPSESGKTIMTIGAFSASNDDIESAFVWLEQAVFYFNSTGYREHEMRVIDYGDLTDPSSFLRLNAHIVTDAAPDLLLTFGMPVENYIASDMLYDMSDWFDSDEFFTGPFEAMKTDNKLFEISPAINVTALYGLPGALEHTDDMTLDELHAIWEGFNDGSKSFLIGLSNIEFCYLVVTATTRQYVDDSTNTCNFDSPEFIQLLEFCLNLPEGTIPLEVGADESYLEYLSGSALRYITRAPEAAFAASVLQGNSLLGVFTTARAKEMGELIDHLAVLRGLLFGETIAYVGIPGANSPAFNMEFPIAVMAGSEHIEIARDFIDTLWNLSFMTAYGDLRAVPLKRDALDRIVRTRYGNTASFAPLMRDEGFDDELIENTLRFIPNSGLKPYTRDEYSEHLEVFNEARLLIRAPAAQYGSDMTFNIHPIIQDELMAFFAGTQDAKRTAELIQMRYSIYLAERG